MDSTWFLVTAQTTNMAPSCSRTTNPDKALRGNPDYGHQHGLKWQHRPLTLIWTPVTARPIDTNMASGSIIDHGWISVWPSVATQTSDINPVPGHIRTTKPHNTLSGIMDYGGLLRKTNSRSEPFHISGFRHYPKPGWAQSWGPNLCLHTLQAAAHNPSDPTGQHHASPFTSALSPTVTSIKSPVCLSPHSTHCSVSP